MGIYAESVTTDTQILSKHVKFCVVVAKTEGGEVCGIQSNTLKHTITLWQIIESTEGRSCFTMFRNFEVKFVRGGKNTNVSCRCYSPTF